MEFDLRFLDEDSRMFLQHAIDGVNKAAYLHDPGAWNFVSAGLLIEANRGSKPLDPIAATIFDEMKQDRHSGSTAGWTIAAVTQVSKNYRAWRDTILVNNLIEMKEELCTFLERRYTEKFPDEEAEWSVRREKVLHDLEYSYLVQHVLSDQDRNILHYLSKIENVSHLGNEVLFDTIEEHLRARSSSLGVSSYPIVSPAQFSHTAP